MSRRLPLAQVLLAGLASLSSCQSNDAPGSRSPADLRAPGEVIKEQPLPATSQPDTSLPAAFTRFTDALRQADTTALNGLIEPAHGLWILEQPGALPLLTRVGDIRGFRRENQQRPFFSLAAELMPCLRPEPVDTLPRATCDGRPGNEAGFARLGCLLAPHRDAGLNGIWPHATLRGGTVAQGQAALARISHTVLQTRSGFRFHWARTAQGWRLVLVDLRIPCSA
ncbi:hypothetical protein [Hymenobacter sp. B81]|uniref:hypothetical protein n=1 Tax=Hymenobacter sp. B81 TaxID=3344878 RepID=UPI0037DC75E1